MQKNTEFADEELDRVSCSTHTFGPLSKNHIAQVLFWKKCYETYYLKSELLEFNI